MYGDTDRGGATTALRFVTCDLSSLRDCVCMSSAASDLTGSSSKRKHPSKPSPLIDPDCLTPLTAKRLSLERPSLIDRLILQSKSALEEMEGKKRGAKRTVTPVKSKVEEKESTKRKRTDSMNGTSPAIKRLRSSKAGSDSESSESRNASTERKRGHALNKDVNKKGPSPKKGSRKTEKSRFSKRIVFSSSSLRSGKKRKEFMKRKRISKSLTRDPKEKKKWGGNDKTDSNSNVCTENDSNEEGVEDSTDSEMSREPFETELVAVKGDTSKSPEDVKKRRKRRKRDSMWVKKVKRQIKAKTESIEMSLPPPALAAEESINEIDDEDGQSSDVLEESDLPVLDKVSDDSLVVDNMTENIVLNTVVQDDVAMPKLEKEVELETPLEKNVTETIAQESGEKVTKNVDSSVEKPIPFSNQDDSAKDVVCPAAQDSQTLEQDHFSVSKPTTPTSDLNERQIDEVSELHIESIQSFADSENFDQSEDGFSEILPDESGNLTVDKSSDFKENELSIDPEIDNKSEESIKSNQSHLIEDKTSDLPEVRQSHLLENKPNHLPETKANHQLESKPIPLPETEAIHLSETKPNNLSETEASHPMESRPSHLPESKPIHHVESRPNHLPDSIATHHMESRPNQIPETKSSQPESKPNHLPESKPSIPVEIKPIHNTEVKSLFIESSLKHLPCNKDEEFHGIEKMPDNRLQELNLKEEISDPESDMLKDHQPFERKDEEDDNIKNVTLLIKHENAFSQNGENGFCKAEVMQDMKCKSEETTMDSSIDMKDISHLDADSTSDMKPQSLDDSFTDFSLSLPDDLELESSPSDEDRGEESDGVLPDSTETGQPDETAAETIDVSQESNVVIGESRADDISSVENNKDPTIGGSKEQKEHDSGLTEPITLNIPEEISFNQDVPVCVSEPVSEELAKPPETKSEELTIEQRQMKESVLQALGLKSLTTQQPEEKPKRDGYTGTLKAVIKLNRSGDKKRMVYQRSEDSLGELEYRICSEIPATDGVPITHLNDISSIRKNVAKLHQDSDINHGSATSNGHSEDHDSSNHDDSKGVSGAKESNLIIPEKSSSFSIHPGRLCSDVCSYCFGKFGCLDTPCHVAQLKAERQKKILENEPHLTAESCLCDACYRYVDRRANCPTKTTSGNANRSRVKPPASSQCCVNRCAQEATHTVKKKWLVKLKKSITNKLDIDLDKPGAMYFPLCAQHHYWVDYFTVCGICRKRLNRNHLYSLGSETDRLNLMLAEDGIPARLSDKLFLCKLCRYYSNLRLKYSDPGSIPSSGQIFYRDYRRKILTSLDIPVSDSEDEHTIKDEKKKSNSGKKSLSDSNGSSNGAAPSSKSEESVMSLSNLATLLGEQPEQQARIQVKFGNVNIGRLSNLNIGQGGRDREERLPYSDVGLQANLDFQGPAVPDGSWERCVSTIQFDKRTKKLWQDLQKPYGNQSSFLRHLVMLEKYWRAGYLTLAQGSDERAAKYLNGVKNRIKAFEGSSEKPLTGQSATPVNSNEKFPLITNTGEIEVTAIKTTQKKTSAPPPVEKKQMTPLDRAKALVRMVPPTQRFPIPIQRYPVPMYVPTYGYPPQHRPPPLLKIRNKTAPQQFYHPLPQSVPSTSILKPILPKLPKALTVTQVPQSGPAITLNRSGITIEKQSGSPVNPPTLPIEKPSISVFREPAPGPS